MSHASAIRRWLLWPSPEIHRRHAMDTAYRAVRRAWFGRRELPADVADRVGLERHRRISALLRAIVHETVFADVQVPRSRAAAPGVRPSVSQVVLKPANPRVEVLE